MKKPFITCAVLLFLAGALLSAGKATFSKLQDAPQWHPVSINFVPFETMFSVPITLERMESQREVTFAEERDFLYFKRLLGSRMEGVKKDAYKFDRLQPRLRYQNGKEVIFVDDQGVVKTPKEEYLLTPRAFLHMSRFLNNLLDEKYGPKANSKAK